MVSARLLITSFIALFLTPAFAGDPHPPQLNISFLAQPAPIVQDGSTRLVYEMVVTNFSNNKCTLDAVETKAGTVRFIFSDSALADMIIPLGASGKPEGAADAPSCWRAARRCADGNPSADAGAVSDGEGITKGKFVTGCDGNQCIGKIAEL